MFPCSHIDKTSEDMHLLLAKRVSAIEGVPATVKIKLYKSVIYVPKQGKTTLMLARANIILCQSSKGRATYIAQLVGKP